MLITTNQTVTQWGHVFGDEMIAAALLDRSFTTATSWWSRATAIAYGRRSELDFSARRSRN
jgi:DNA replication protein DnaC